MPKRRTAFLILVLTTIYGLVYWHAWPQAPCSVSDSPGYLEVARDLADGRLDQLQERVPGFPLLLVWTRSHATPRRALFAVQLLLHAVATLALCALLYRLTASKPSVIALATVAVLPPSVSHAGYVMSETLAEFWLIASVCALTRGLLTGRWEWIVLGAVATGWSALVRPTYSALAIAFVAVLWVLARRLALPRQRFRAASLALLLASGVAVGGYAGFNLMRFGYFGTTPLLGFNLCTRTVRVVERLPDEHRQIRTILVQHRDSVLVRRSSDHTATMYVWEAIPELREKTGLSMSQLNRKLLRLNVKLIARGPMWYVAAVLESAAHYWMPSVPLLANFDSQLLQIVWAAVGFGLNLVFLAVVALALGSCVLGACVQGLSQTLRRAAPGETCVALGLAVTVVLYTFCISSVVEVGNPRYRAPTDLLALFASLLALNAWRRLRSNLPVQQVNGSHRC